MDHFDSDTDDHDYDTLMDLDMSEEESSDDDDDEDFVARLLNRTPQTEDLVSEYSKEDTEDDPNLREILPGAEWTKSSRPTANPLFSEPSGNIADEFEGLKLPVEYFLKFFDYNIISHILEQTNLYNQQQHQKEGKKRIEPVTLKELFAFFGLTLFMGYHKVPSLRLYWSTNPHLGVPLVGDTMARDRYFDILSNLHVNDNNLQPADNKDKMYKLRPLITALNNNFRALRLPGQHLSIDESTVKFKGRHSLKMYNSMKPHKRHFKLWSIAEMSSYMFGFDVYQGKDGMNESEDIDTFSRKRILEETSESEENILPSSPKKAKVSNSEFRPPLASFQTNSLSNNIVTCSRKRSLEETNEGEENILSAIPKKAKVSHSEFRSPLSSLQTNNLSTLPRKGRPSKSLGSQIPQPKTIRAKTAEVALGTKVVMSLVKQLGLEGKNHILAFDNYYTSPDLMEKLYKKGVYAVGTVRPNRVGLPKQMMDNKKMHRGDIDYRLSSSGLFYIKWNDNKPVHFLSNYHGYNRCTVKRRLPDGSKAKVKALSAVADYNKHMGGVDKADMLRALYELDRKARKFWHRLFFSMMEISLVNSFVSFKEKNRDSDLTLLLYKVRVADGLIQMSKEKKKGRPSQNPILPTLGRSCKRKFSVSEEVRFTNRGHHWPLKVVDKNDNVARGRCEYCSVVHLKENKTTFKCSTCKAFLCLEAKRNCFFDFHHQN